MSAQPALSAFTNPGPATRAEYAWETHRALVLAEAADPSLKDNPAWNLLRMDAYEAFHDALVGA